MKLCFRLAALALLLSVAVAQDDTDLSPGLIRDRAGLLALKSKISSFGNSQVEMWKASGSPCNWAHVRCSSGDDPRVIELDLSNRGIVGELPVGLRKAALLQKINLANNKFTGGIPNDWAKANSFTSLQVLNLANNELSATMPIWNRRGAWKSLEVLDLSSNKMYGGLPANWLGKYRPLKNLKRLDLSGNLLGTSDGKEPYTKWCESEYDAGMKDGSGWCPVDTPLADTASSLVYLDLSDNGFVGMLPPKWPKMFPRLQYLKLHLNGLYGTNYYEFPSVLPKEWTFGPEVFPSLSILTLYPGNNYLCSLPDSDGNFQGVNLHGTYQIADATGVMYGDGEPRLCPAWADWVDYDEDYIVVPSYVELFEDAAHWRYEEVYDSPIWGYKVTIAVRDKESQEWSPVKNGNGIRLRTYSKGLDDSMPFFGLTEGYSDLFEDYIWVLRFAEMDDEIKIADLNSTNYPSNLYDGYRLSVSIITMDNVVNSPAEYVLE